MDFASMPLSEPLLRAVRESGYSQATPIQAQAIPHVLAGRDLVGCAQTGTGKTAAFALPMLARLSPATPAPRGPKRVRGLVLCPTRELALQIQESFRTYGRHQPLRCAAVFGGVGQRPQVEALRGGAEIIVATPGRLLDLMQQGHADLRHVEVLVLDEADRMLDMGFINDLRRILAAMPPRQTLLFSATMPAPIRQLAAQFLRQPAIVQVAPASAAADHIEQSAYMVERQHKPALLAHLVTQMAMSRVIVFTRTKHGADRVARQLHQRGIRAEAIHGNKTQGARQRTLENFRSNRVPVLVATDIASRGIDVDGISHVVNFDLSDEPEAYVHRIGRTARAGASGAAVTFVSREDIDSLRAVERLIRQPITMLSLPDEVRRQAAAMPATDSPPRRHAQAPRPARSHARPNSSSKTQATHSVALESPAPAGASSRPSLGPWRRGHGTRRLR